MDGRTTRHLKSTPAPQLELEPGAQLSQYNLVRFLGSGGFGQVWESVDQFGHPLALKIITIDDDADPARVIHEYSLTRSLSDLRHIVRYENPQILPEHDSGMPSLLLLPMELMDGDLSDLETILTPMTMADRIHLVFETILPQVCDGLRTAHAAGIVHRDIKPGNILYRDGQSVFKLADFGLASVVEHGMESQHSQGNVGTAVFMAPEQLSGNQWDFRSDIYSLGVTVCDILFGTPYTDSLPNEFRRVADLLDRCTEKNPAKRYQSIEDVAAALDDIRRTRDLPSRDESESTPIDRSGTKNRTLIPETVKKSLEDRYGDNEYVVSLYRLARAVVSNGDFDPNDMEITNLRIAIWEVQDNTGERRLLRSLWRDEIQTLTAKRRRYRPIGYYAAFLTLLATGALIPLLAILMFLSGSEDKIGFILGMIFAGSFAMSAGIVIGILNLHRRRTDVQISGKMAGLSVSMFAEDAEALTSAPI